MNPSDCSDLLTGQDAVTASTATMTFMFFGGPAEQEGTSLSRFKVSCKAVHRELETKISHLNELLSTLQELAGDEGPEPADPSPNGIRTERDAGSTAGGRNGAV